MEFRRILLVGLVVFACGARVWADDPAGDAYCASVLLMQKPLSLRFEKMAVDTVLAKRKIGVMGEKPIVFKIAGHSYDKVSVLGTSSTRAYLALDENGGFVVVKKDWPIYSKDGTVENYEEKDWLMTYDQLVAEFYREKGVEVPRVIAVDFAHRLEVKDYEEGLTVDDLESSRFADSPILKDFSEESKVLNSLLDIEIERIREIHHEFRDWLVKHDPPPSKEFMSEAERLIDRGDLKRANFLFSVKRQKWILFDP